MMPNVSTLISGAVSLSVLAGFVSGIVYLVVAGIRWAGLWGASLSTRDPWPRGAHEQRSSWQRMGTARPRRGLEVVPGSSGLRGCPAVCSREARLHTGEWLYRQVQQRLSNRAVTEASDSSKSDENGRAMEDTDTAQVREFIEKLVENLVEGELDDVNVSCLYDHPEYKPLKDVESPSVIHAQLKQLVKRVVHEAMTMPRLKQAMEKRMPNGRSAPQDIDSKTYEDILATAILNKVIEKYQRYSASSSDSGVDSNRNVLDGFSLSAPANGKPKHNDRQKREVDVSDASTQEGSCSEASHTDPVSFMVEECIEQVTTYNSSEDDLEHGTSTELDFYLSGLNFIQRHRVPFPELGMDIVDGEGSEHSDSDADDAAGRTSSHPTDLLSPVDSWEENWLFQKRRLKLGSNVNQPIPVPMLVPNPSEGFRALIGDQDAEEISDLSECSEEAVEDMSDVGSVQSFTFLGRDSRIEELPEGQDSKDEVPMEHVKVQENNFRAVTPDGGYGGSAEEYASIQDGGSEMAEATNAQLFKSSSVDCLSEFGQQDSEYTEDYTAATRRQMSSLTLQDELDPDTKPVPRPRSVGGACVQQKPAENSSKTEDEGVRPEVDLVLATPPRPGTIAEREHKKWETAPPLANNPYSSENISKRLQKRVHRDSRSSSDASLDFPDAPADTKPVVSGPLKVCVGAEPDSKKYSRDYYVNSGGEGRAKTEQQPMQQAKVSGLSVTSLEEEMLQRDIYHFTFRARNASPNFLVNPLYEGGQWEHDQLSQRAVGKPRSESGYDSSLDSVTGGESSRLLRLTPPPQPQMVERSFETLSSIRRAASFKHRSSKGSCPPPALGGSLRSRVKGRGLSASDIW